MQARSSKKQFFEFQDNHSSYLVELEPFEPLESQLVSKIFIAKIIKKKKHFNNMQQTFAAAILSVVALDILKLMYYITTIE